MITLDKIEHCARRCTELRVMVESDTDQVHLLGRDAVHTLTLMDVHEGELVLSVTEWDEWLEYGVSDDADTALDGTELVETLMAIDDRGSKR